jgi:hypothetical protein
MTMKNEESAENKQIAEIINDNALKKQWRDELSRSVALQEFFKDYQPYSVEGFIDHLIGYKLLWHKYGDFYKEQNEKEALQWTTAAFEHLAIIQQKKLFDMQCLWRAEKITLPDIEICFDFNLWEHNILNCPFITPITEEDIDLYIQYLLQDNIIEADSYESWQDYDGLKEAYLKDEENRNMPDWYEFYNGRKGTGTYMLLPDIRGEKEEFYSDIARAAAREKNKASEEEFEKNRDKRQALSYYNDKFMNWYVSTFEDKLTQKRYKAYSAANRKQPLEEDIESHVRLLLTANEYEFVPIEAHHNWIEALERAVNKFRYKKIAEALPQAWEQYKMNLDMGIAFPKNDRMQDIRSLFLENILKGRALNGEPEDLNF